MIQNSPTIELQRTREEHARQGLLAFTTYTMPEYLTNWHHAELAKRLDRVAAGECQRLMVIK